jgi:hypothetical protein
MELTPGQTNEANLYGRERLRPNRGFPTDPGKTREPTRMTRCGERNERFVNGSIFGDGSRPGVFWALYLLAVRLWGSRVVRVGRETLVRTEPSYHPERLGAQVT